MIEHDCFKKADGKISESYCLHCGFCFPGCKRLIEGKGASECKNCLMCYSVCPRLHPSTESQRIEKLPFGRYIKILSVKCVEKQKNVQNSGVVTLLVKYLLNEGWAEAALLTGRRKDWTPEPFWAKRPEDAEKASGSKYSISPASSYLRQGFNRFDRFAIVGLPCQVAAVHNFQRLKKNVSTKEREIFTIGLFCMNSFIHEGFRSIIESEMKIPMEKVKKIEIRKGKVQVFSSASQKAVVGRLKMFENVIWPVCVACTDFTALLADISIGSVGTEDNENTVIVRTDKANQLINELIKKGLIETRELQDLAEIKKIVKINHQRRDKLNINQKKLLGKKTVLGNWLNRLDL